MKRTFRHLIYKPFIPHLELYRSSPSPLKALTAYRNADMMTIPDPEWVDLDDDLEGFARSGTCSLVNPSRLYVWFGRPSPLLPARETWNYMLPVVPDDDGMRWPDGPSDFEAFNSLGAYSHLVIDYLQVVSTDQRMPPGIFDAFHQPQDGFNLTALPSTLGDLYTVWPQLLLVSSGVLLTDRVLL
jgi:hypothetical protein